MSPPNAVPQSFPPGPKLNLKISESPAPAATPPEPKSIFSFGVCPPTSPGSTYVFCFKGTFGGSRRAAPRTASAPDAPPTQAPSRLEALWKTLKDLASEFLNP